jgi:hypothetical protein
LICMVWSHTHPLIIARPGCALTCPGWRDWLPCRGTICDYRHRAAPSSRSRLGPGCGERDGRRGEGRDRNHQRLAGPRLPSSSLFFRQDRAEAFVRRFVLAAGRLAQLRSFNEESSIISAKAAQKGAHLPGELRLQGTALLELAQRTEVFFFPGSPLRALCPARATDLLDWLFSLVLPCSSPLPSGTPPDTLFPSFIPPPTLWLPLERCPMSSRLSPVPAGVPSASTP